ncbi:glutathione S-transferase family protein [Rheinheimera texasensis]|uniref:glutathione S-transferase family protein n=1 Tax=Rheinheimera texasensis TaxID=306205 RepID=UPI0004E12487|nr:glutathione S-transferase family protein [Rheinheimera texasensis]
MYKLFYAPGTASMVIHQLLIELNQPVELILLDFATNQQKSAEFLRLNQQGRVPVLVDGAVTLYESAAILLYLTEKHQQLAPLPGSSDRGLFLQHIMFLTNNLAPQFRLWFYPADLGIEQYPAELRQQLQQNISAVWQQLDDQLSQRGPYLLGDTFSAADLMLTMYMRWSRNMPKTALAWPALQRLADLVRSRPSWRQLYKQEQLTEWAGF